MKKRPPHRDESVKICHLCSFTFTGISYDLGIDEEGDTLWGCVECSEKLHVQRTIAREERELQ